MLKTLFLVFTSVSAFKLLPNTKIPLTFPQVISYCDGIHPSLLETTRDAAQSMTQAGYHVVIAKKDDNPLAVVCDEKNGHFGYSIVQENPQKIFINEVLINVPNTLYNVVFHEILHVVGLDHSTKTGLMSYAVRTDFYGFPHEDSHRLWLSQDDLAGLYIVTKKLRMV